MALWKTLNLILKILLPVPRGVKRPGDPGFGYFQSPQVSPVGAPTSKPPGPEGPGVLGPIGGQRFNLKWISPGRPGEIPLLQV